MNKKMMSVLAILAIICGVSTVWAHGGFAEHHGGFVGNNGGFVGPQAEPKSVTVEEAKSMDDESRILIKGHIINAAGDEDYMFKDNTGTIKVEIDKDIWKGVTVKPEDNVEILGEVDRHLQKETSIEAEAIAIVPSK